MVTSLDSYSYLYETSLESSRWFDLCEGLIPVIQSTLLLNVWIITKLCTYIMIYFFSWKSRYRYLFFLQYEYITLTLRKLQRRSYLRAENVSINYIALKYMNVSVKLAQNLLLKIIWMIILLERVTTFSWLIISQTVGASLTSIHATAAALIHAAREKNFILIGY